MCSSSARTASTTAATRSRGSGSSRTRSRSAPTVGGGTGFTGVHENGDLLVISDFSNGGTTSTITVYKWDPDLHGNQ